MSAYRDLLDDTVQTHRDEVMRMIKAHLDEHGTDGATVVTMEECKATGRVIHDVIETADDA